MFLTTHAAVGIAISQTVSGPLPVFAWSFASHFLLDFIPHGDDELYRDEEWKIHRRFRRVLAINAIDAACLIGLSLWAINQTDTTSTNLMLVGILGSVLPDFLNFLFPVVHQRFSWLFVVRWLYAMSKPTGLRYLVRVQDWFHQLLHHKIIRSDVPFAVGLTGQVILVAIALGYVLRTG